MSAGQRAPGVPLRVGLRHAQKSFDGLHALVTQSMELDAPFGGHLFVFANRRRDQDQDPVLGSETASRSGRNDWKRGTYAMPFEDAAEKRREITAAELGAILSGIDLSDAKRRKRYRRNISTQPHESIGFFCTEKL